MRSCHRLLGTFCLLGVTGLAAPSVARPPAPVPSAPAVTPAWGDNTAFNGRPHLSFPPTEAEMDHYAAYFVAQGYTVRHWRQKVQDGRMVLFEFRADCPIGPAANGLAAPLKIAEAWGWGRSQQEWEMLRREEWEPAAPVPAKRASAKVQHNRATRK